MTSVNSSLESGEALGIIVSRSNQSSRRTTFSTRLTRRSATLKRSSRSSTVTSVSITMSLCWGSYQTGSSRSSIVSFTTSALPQDKSELQVGKFMSHHCHGDDVGIVVYLVRSGYWATQTHIDFNNVKEVYKQFQALKYQPYRPRIIEDNRYGGSSFSSSPMSERD